MVILAANQVWWTWEVEDTFMKVKKGDKMGLKNYSRKLHTQISEVVVKVHIRMLYTYIKHMHIIACNFVCNNFYAYMYSCIQ